jgi:hypothetical protein
MDIRHFHKDIPKLYPVPFTEVIFDIPENDDDYLYYRDDIEFDCEFEHENPDVKARFLVDIASESLRNPYIWRARSVVPKEPYGIVLQGRVLMDEINKAIKLQEYLERRSRVGRSVTVIVRSEFL